MNFPSIFRLNSLQFKYICQSKMNIHKAMVSLRQQILQNAELDKSIMIEGVESSSQDFNQSIFRTIDKKATHHFWSSTGSSDENDCEYLIYKLAANQSLEKGLIFSVIISVFQANYMPNSPLFPPLRIQIEIGNAPGKYHYKSKIFQFEQNTTRDQVFCLLPDIVCGEYIKIGLIGKTEVQATDNLKYIALGYVGAQGCLIEELKNQDIINMVTFESKEHEVKSYKDEEVKQQSHENLISVDQFKSDIRKIKDGKLSELPEYLFKQRQVFLNNFSEVWDQKVLEQTDTIDLFDFSTERFGQLDFYQTMLLFKILDSLKQDDLQAYQYLERLSASHQIHELRYIKEVIQKFSYESDPDSKISTGTKLLFFQTFQLTYNIFEYNLKATNSIETIQRAFQFLNYLGYNIAYQKGEDLDVERLVNAIVEKFGRITTGTFLEYTFGNIMWQTREKEKLRAVIEKLKVQDDRSAQDASTL
ncbi:UNKNOWN [Stylonychia lemnae]|uniref:Uncharacterized protein n=1 Tax=Stylonychia lemnae TaxID=5949 RepID=A0A078A1D3_STYLE|nr:UNKNOWN [Stylonychia lemnae]|eukprot:CDW74589.1 UNKNOWN [Stylonychia lemnae]